MTAEATSVWHRLWNSRWRDLVRGQVDGRLNWRQIIAEQDLPASVRSLIELVVRRTRLWRSEKTDVARELIAHFQDGLEAGAATPQLIDSFGDPLQAAKLIRRAKRRGRSLAWQIWHWACLAFGVLLISYAAMSVYYVTGRPTIKVDYLAVLNKRAVAAPEEARAWPLYRRALSQLMVDRKFPPWLTNNGTPPTGAEWPVAVAWLKEHEAGLALVREATERPEMGFAVGVSPKAFSPEDQKLFFDPADDRLDPQIPNLDRIEDQSIISTHLPHLVVLRSVASLLAVDAQRAALAGEAEVALADVRAILGVAEHVEQMPCLVVTVVAASVQKFAFTAVAEVLRAKSGLWSAGQMRDLAHAVAAAQIDWQRGFDGEHMMFLDTMQRFYTDDGHGDGHLAFRGPEGLNVFDALTRFTGGGPGNPFAHDTLAAALMPAANMYVASRKETTELYEAMLNDAILKVETPLWMLPREHLSEVDFRAMFENPWKDSRNFFVSLLLPAFDRVRNNAVALDGARDGALVGIALELYRREHKVWPNSLAELSPQWLPAVPIDRITGKTLRYKVVDDKPVVYSVGPDGDDDGGLKPIDVNVKADDSVAPLLVETKPQDGDWVIWSTTLDE